MIVAALVCAPAFADDAAGRAHWAFRPVERPLPPAVRDARLVESPIDAFILERLEAAGLEPAPAADKRTLIRRASYDLIGLPPTSAEVADFMADPSPDAFATVVERLLASPHYGERWGRHWLDVARYANTRGDTGGADPVSPFAFTYRDYVVSAFNADLPYDRFLIEQIAADQLALGESAPALAALGFITVGRRFLNNVHDTIDDRIDVVTRGTMALTVSCARCHDHKYDPIPTRDYYGLYGVFASSNEPDPLPVVGMPDPAAFLEYQSLRQKLDAKRQDIIGKQEAEILERHRKLTAEHLLASRAPPEKARSENETAFPDPNALVQRAGAMRWKMALEKCDTASDPIFAPWFAFAALSETDFADRARELSAKIAGDALKHPVNRLVAQAFAGEPPASLKEVADRYARLVEEAAGQASQPQPETIVPAISDGARAELQKALLGDDGPAHLPQSMVRQLLAPMVQMQLQQLGSEFDRIDARHPGAPLRAMVLYDNPQAQNARIFIRGNPNNPGDEAPRQFLHVLAGENRRPFTTGSGRLELARAIANRDNALTARVIVNRVWLHHFGEGLVTTPDDFGVRSQPPSHPQLLDYLAARFMDEGWSLKKLHRWLMLSRVYRQSSDDGLHSEAADPENRLLSKANRRRLDFEPMRDTLLFVAGNLDRTVGGRTVELAPQPRVSPGGGFAGAGDQSPSPRRAIYGFIDRQNLPQLLRAFDFADPDTITGRRYATTSPQQALFFFNNSFVMQQASSLAGRAEFQRLDAPLARMAYLYQSVFQRDPTADEIELGRRFIETEQASSAPQPKDATAAPEDKPRAPPLGPWERYAQTLLMSDELMFVD
ncbi:MAG TPA: DUF1549 and DUF1553 domain-containing protein [Planctomycetaceae bacterium]|nr:DUF1549 and DUF1553 domain-containing protein [Planctomycetaceae bacterium]